MFPDTLCATRKSEEKLGIAAKTSDANDTQYITDTPTPIILALIHCYRTTLKFLIG